MLQVFHDNFALPDLKLHRLRVCGFLSEAPTKI